MEEWKYGMMGFKFHYSNIPAFQHFSEQKREVL